MFTDVIYCVWLVIGFIILVCHYPTLYRKIVTT